MPSHISPPRIARIPNATRSGTIFVAGSSPTSADYVVLGINSGAAVFPATIQPQDVAVITVLFNPSVIGLDNAVMTIANNSNNAPNATVALVGVGIDANLNINWPLGSNPRSLP